MSTEDTQSPFHDEEGNLCLKGENYWKFRALQAECDKVTSQLAYTNREIEILMAKVPELREAFVRKNELMKESSVAAGELHQFNVWLQGQLNIDLTKCGIDEKTGRIHVPDTGPPVTTNSDERSAGSASA